MLPPAVPFCPTELKEQESMTEIKIRLRGKCKAETTERNIQKEKVYRLEDKMIQEKKGGQLKRPQPCRKGGQTFTGAGQSV